MRSPARPLPGVRLPFVAIVVLVLAAAGCGTSPAPVSGDPTPSVSESTPGPGVATELTVVATDDAGVTSTWQLTCEPAGGTHPDPTTACRVLADFGAQALPPVPKDRACTQVFGGSETATVTGTWRGTVVQSSFSRTNGCEIARWTMLTGLLPKPGG